MADETKPEKARTRKPITQERLMELLRYDPATGIVTRLTSGSGFTAGERAGCEKKHGYRTIDVDGVRYYEHRLAVFYMTGEWPLGKVDHRDTIRSANIWSNLRPATDAQNVANRRMNKTNRIGFKGVVKHCDPNRRKPFGARIKVNRKSRHLGWFETPQEAHVAYCRAALEVHGEFARME